MSEIIGPSGDNIYDDLINGTCELDQSFGTVQSGSIDLPEDIQEILDCNGNVSAVLLRDDKIAYSFTALFPSTTTMPARGDNVSFPDVAGVGIVGQIVSVKVNWEQSAQRSLDIVARHWTGIGSAPTITAIV